MVATLPLPDEWTTNGLATSTIEANAINPTRARIECCDSLLWNFTGARSLNRLHLKHPGLVYNQLWCECLSPSVSLAYFLTTIARKNNSKIANSRAVVMTWSV